MKVRCIARAALVVATALAVVIAPSSGAAFAAAEQATPPMSKSEPQCRGSEGYAADFGGRRTFLWTPGMLIAAKARLAADPAAMAALRKEADAALERETYSVVDKDRAGPSGDKHDYRSLAPYWWPTPGKPKGEPYTRKDGRINPERNSPNFDKERLENFGEDVSLLALAYYHTGDERYARRAAELVRTWFVDPATRMNPNLDYAQAVPGRELGRGEGVIDAFRLLPVVESIGLLAPSGAVTRKDDAALKAWFVRFVEWMATSKNGKEEIAKGNNHGIYFDMLISEFSLFARLDGVADTVIRLFPQRRLDPQFAADGTLPEELERTRSWHYTLWTLIAATRVAQLGNCIGKDLSAYRNPDGAGLPIALDLAAAIAEPQTDWPYKDIAFGDAKKMRSEDQLAYETFASAAWYFDDPDYTAAAQRYLPAVADSEVMFYLGPPPSE